MSKGDHNQEKKKEKKCKQYRHVEFRYQHTPSSTQLNIQCRLVELGHQRKPYNSGWLDWKINIRMQLHSNCTQHRTG